MTLLRDLSICWAVVHVLLIFIILYESRFPRRKTRLLTLCFMGPLMLINVLLYLKLGPAQMAQIVLLTCTLPSLVFFFFTAKHRGGKFLFTFCFADTVAYEILCVSLLLDFYLPGDRYIVMFILRLIAFPLLELAALKWLQGPYIKMQQSVKGGWLGFAFISALFYVILVYMSSYPVLITERPEDIPLFILVLFLMPLTYWCIFSVLLRQQEIYQFHEQHQLLKLQSSMILQRMEQTKYSEEQLAIHRHDLRHRFRTLSTMLEKGDVQSAREYLSSAEELLEETKVTRWCRNPVLDAVFSFYFGKAKTENIRIEADLDLPEDLHVDAAELSTVFANALENAIHAVMKLPDDKRIICCKCIHSPQLMFRVSNPFSGEIAFGPEGFPAVKNEPHGIGSRSIDAYCKKHGAFCDYKAEKGWFTIQIIQP